MKYLYQIEGNIRNNIGDVLQGLVAKTFLPAQAEVVNRENLSSINTNEPAYFVANGWYLHIFDHFPPPDNVKPLYVSVHIADSALLRDQRVRSHFEAHSPIGCRDRKTLKLFLGWGIPAYYSGCLTITSQPRAIVNNTGKGECLLVDNVDHPIPENVKAKLELLLGTSLVRLSHDPLDTSGSLNDYNNKSTIQMEALLNRYCRARLVITTKIHCALPCIGMGANVLPIHPNPSDPRLDALREFIDILSYKQLLRMETLKLPAVKKEILKKRRKFLHDIVAKGVETLSNPVGTLPEYNNTLKRSIRAAKRYRFAIKLMLKLGIKNQTFQRIYGT